MSVSKNAKTGKWEVRTYFKNIDGQLKQKTRRGFKLKSEALQWEQDFKNQRNFSLDMTFARFCEIYFGDIEPRLKHNTMLTKRHIVEHKILPYFSDKKINAIKPADIIQWQNILIKSGLSSTYLKTIHNQLSAIFNHAVNLYELKANPAKKAGKIGSKTPDSEMQFWTKNEYLLFREAIADKAISYYAFEVLYWTGCRLGELLVLTVEDFDFKNQTMRINKSYQKFKGKEYITTPKTPKSVRTISLPDFLAVELESYISMLFGFEKTDRIFMISRGYLHSELNRGVKISGVKRIRIHDLRHSHISLLIDLGFSAVAIGERVGHESVEITYHYAHLFPTVQSDMAKKLNCEMECNDKKG